MPPDLRPDSNTANRRVSAKVTSDHDGYVWFR